MVLTDAFPHTQELDKWLRSRTVENVATATATLKSLTELLNSVSNMVIRDAIGEEVQRAVTNIQQAHTYLTQGRLRQAFATARQAIISSGEWYTVSAPSAIYVS